MRFVIIILPLKSRMLQAEGFGWFSSKICKQEELIYHKYTVMLQMTVFCFRVQRNFKNKQTILIGFVRHVILRSICDFCMHGPFLEI